MMAIKPARLNLIGIQLIRGPAFFAKHEEVHLEVLAGATKRHFKRSHLTAVDGDIDLAAVKSR
jgi:hypothetical protein